MTFLTLSFETFSCMDYATFAKFSYLHKSFLDSMRVPFQAWTMAVFK